MNTTQFLLTAWPFHPFTLLAAGVALAAYARWFGWTRRAGWMVAAAVVFLLTSCSPLDTLADGYLFSAHMLQHIMLVLIVPALSLMALPSTLHAPRAVNLLANPVAGWLCGVGAMWIWHAPALCNAAVASQPVHAMQTVSLLALGSIFWWQLLAPSEDQRIPALGGVIYLFTACTACTVLGVILAFSPVTVCRAYLQPVDRLGIEPLIQGTWGVTPARDQQVGGLIMWVPMCLVYLCAIFGQLTRWYHETSATSTSTAVY